MTWVVIGFAIAVLIGTLATITLCTARSVKKPAKKEYSVGKLDLDIQKKYLPVAEMNHCNKLKILSS